MSLLSRLRNDRNKRSRSSNQQTKSLRYRIKYAINRLQAVYGRLRNRYLIPSYQPKEPVIVLINGGPECIVFEPVRKLTEEEFQAYKRQKEQWNIWRNPNEEEMKNEAKCSTVGSQELESEIEFESAQSETIEKEETEIEGENTSVAGHELESEIECESTKTESVEEERSQPISNDEDIIDIIDLYLSDEKVMKSVVSYLEHNTNSPLASPKHEAFAEIGHEHEEKSLFFMSFESLSRVSAFGRCKRAFSLLV